MKDMQTELNLKDYINVLRRRRGIIILFFVTTVLVVTVGSIIMTPIYRATSIVLIDIESPDVLTATGTVTLESQGYYTYKEYYQSQKEIITSRSIARRVFEEFNLGEKKEYKKAKDPIKDFLKTIKVDPVRDTRLLELSVENKDPVLAADITNRMGEIYVKRNLYYISRAELMNLLKNEYLKLETKLSEYSKLYKDKHPKMIRLKEEIGDLVKRIEDVKESAFNFDIIETDFTGDDKYALEGLKANNVSIQDPAEVPILPVRPKKRLNVLLAMVVGLFGGVGLAFFFEYLDDTVKDTEDLEKLGDWPFLGGVPKMEIGSKPEELKEYLLTHNDSKNPVAEAYRAIRTSVFFSSTEEHPLNSILVTSPGPQEGKSTVLCNLGIAIAQSRKKVLLVDADMRKPKLHEIFGAKNKNGLTEFLCAKAKFSDIIKETSIENVSFVNGGVHPPNPSELLSGHKIKEFIEEAKKKFDYILFDTPPIAVVTDALVLSRAVGGVILVAETNKTSRRVLPRVHHILQDAKAHVIGKVLNKISPTSRNYYYYSSYYGKTE